MNRENIQKVRDVIAGLSAKRFKMDDWSVNYATGWRATPSEILHGCGSAACIAGWACAIADPDNKSDVGGRAFPNAQSYLGLSWDDANALFQPRDIAPLAWSKITRPHAVRVLDHLLATGEVDWKTTRRAKKASA